ncbi:MAG: 4-(cytidine 5'-diphospho)-2-C-methyl-D-erythritol kinase [Erysipelotrichales bacterium]
MIFKSYAKINFAINIKNKLDNGYHELDMIMAKINLYDKLYFSTFKEDEIRLTCSNQFVPTNQKNLIYRVIERFKEEFSINEGIRVHIIKSIPMQAGLGGGSSNAATTLDALLEMYNIEMSLEEKVDFVSDLGSDIPFFFNKNCARVSGLGDVMEPITNNLDDMHIILVKPNKGLSTRMVYANVDLDTCAHPDIDSLVDAFDQNDYQFLVNNIGNSLQDSAIEMRPVIKKLMDELIELGVDATLVCGSGSTIFALTKDKKVVDKVKKAHSNKKNFVYITKLINEK